MFNFIAAEARLDPKEMYGTFNMGAGYAVYVPESQADEVAIIAATCGFQSWVAGRIEAGPRRVVVEPLGIVFEGESLGIR